MSGSEYAFMQTSRHISANTERGVCEPAFMRLGGNDARVADDPISWSPYSIHQPVNIIPAPAATRMSHVPSNLSNPLAQCPIFRHGAAIIDDEIE